MDLYAKTSYELAELLTKRYSTSFSLSSQLFDRSIRPDIFAIYGMVRIADEIVDTYRGDDARAQLDALQLAVTDAIRLSYSTNPILHAFALTARKFGIGRDLIEPFFDSMRTDLTATIFNEADYRRYIYGSAEVVGLMCLKVFVGGDAQRYEALKDGAQKLGAAYQKVNFLRDMKADYDELGRVYFPGVTFETFTENDKQAIIADIKRDFSAADPVISQLPKTAKKAVRASYYYYSELAGGLDAMSADQIKTSRARVADWRKLTLLAKARLIA